MINEKDAFAIIKKSVTTRIYKDDNNIYWVTNGCFVFKTIDTEALISSGLIDFKGSPRENYNSLKNHITNASTNVELKYTGLIIEDTKYNAAILSGDTGFVAVNDKHLKLFYNPFAKNMKHKPDNATFSSNGDLRTPIYIWGNDGLMIGLILPIRLNDEQLEQLELVDKVSKWRGHLGLCKEA